jgi:hypothetical protein
MVKRTIGHKKSREARGPYSGEGMMYLFFESICDVFTFLNFFFNFQQSGRPAPVHVGGLTVKTLWDFVT